MARGSALAADSVVVIDDGAVQTDRAAPSDVHPAAKAVGAVRRGEMKSPVRSIDPAPFGSIGALRCVGVQPNVGERGRAAADIQPAAQPIHTADAHGLVVLDGAVLHR